MHPLDYVYLPSQKRVKLFCKRLPSHTGQEQACSRFTRLFVRDHAKNGPIHRKMVVACPLVITSKVELFFRPDNTRKEEWMVQPVVGKVDTWSCYLLFSCICDHRICNMKSDCVKWKRFHGLRRVSPGFYFVDLVKAANVWESSAFLAMFHIDNYNHCTHNNTR